MAKGKERQPKKKPQLNEQFLKNLEAEDEMHSDHGPVIIGRRDQKPKIPNGEKNEK